MRVLSTTRAGGCSRGPYCSFNLGGSTGDAPAAVANNRRVLREHLPAAPRWLRQVHGTQVVHLNDWHPDIEADAAWTDVPGQVAAILTADCLPVIFAHRSGEFAAAAHAGWRGLAAGILSTMVKTLPARPFEIIAWIGPCIGPFAYEVGAEVRDAFPGRGEFFRSTGQGGFLADLPGLARRELNNAGVRSVGGGELCTAGDPERFFSYRRDGDTGRMATLVWIDR